MSWDVYLECECCGQEIVQRNYTHNTNRMIAVALESLGCVNANASLDWWERLDGCSGPEGAVFPGSEDKAPIRSFKRFRAMNPVNGWGDFDSLVKVLTEMRDSVPEFKTRWRALG